MKQSILENAKTMLAVNKRVLKGLHDTLGFNFASGSVEIKELKTPFTTNKILKENNLEGKFAVILVKRQNYEKRFHAVILNNDGKIFINGFNTGWDKGLDDFYRKADFEYERRTSELAFLVIADKEDVKFDIDKISEYGRGYSYEHQLEKKLLQEYKNDIKCIHRLKFTQPFYNSSDVMYRVTGGYIYNKNEHLSVETNYCNTNKLDVIDKSGYFAYIKRDWLEWEAKKIREKRDLQKLQNTSFSAENEKIRVRIFKTKERLIQELSNTSFDNKWTPGSESKYKTLISKLEGLNTLYIDYLKHIEKLNDAYNSTATTYWNKYGSKDDVQQAIDTLNTRLNEM